VRTKRAPAAANRGSSPCDGHDASQLSCPPHALDAGGVQKLFVFYKEDNIFTSITCKVGAKLSGSCLFARFGLSLGQMGWLLDVPAQSFRWGWGGWNVQSSLKHADR